VYIINPVDKTDFSVDAVCQNTFDDLDNDRSTFYVTLCFIFRFIV